MIKALQKYKMYVLVVAGILIIVSFLLADTLRQIGNYSMENERRYTVDGQKVTQGDLQKAEIHRSGVERSMPAWKQYTENFHLDDDSTQWQLLAMAADKAGLVGGPVDGRMFVQQRVALPQLAMQFGTREQRYTDWRKNMMAQFNLTEEQVDQRLADVTERILVNAGRTGNAASEGAAAFAELRGMLRLFETYTNVTQTSENRMAAEARRLLDVGVIKYIYVPITDARIAAVAAPTAEELQAQFDKYKDTPVGTGENGFGYRQGDRVTYSWFAIDRQAVSKAVTIDPIEVSKRAQSSTASVDPTTLRRQIEDQLRGEQTARALDEFTSALRTEFLRGSATLPEKDGYKVLPADWKKPDLNAIVGSVIARLATEKKITIPATAVNVVGKPEDIKAFSMENVIGTARLPRTGQAPVMLRDVLFGAKELGKPVGKIPAQVGLPIPTGFTSSDGSLCFVMLDGVMPAASPKNLDEVRADVEKDVRKIKALAQLKTEIDAKVPAIAVLDMSEATIQLAAMGYPGLAVQSGLAQRYSAMQGAGVANDKGQPAQPEVQNSNYVDAVMTRAEKLDPGMKVAPDTALDRTFAFQTGGGVILTQITGLKPVTQEVFRAVVSDNQFRTMLEMKDIGDTGALVPFKTDTLVKRMNVVGLDRTKKTEEP